MYGASNCIRDILCRGCAVVTSSWLETRTGWPRDQPRPARKLSWSVLLPTIRCLQFQDHQPRDVDHTLFMCFLELLVAFSRTMGPSSLRLGSVSHDVDRVLHVYRDRAIHVLCVCEFLNVFCWRPRYLTTTRLVYASNCIMDLLCHGYTVVTASFRETRTRGPRDQPRTARELSWSVLFSTERCL